MVGGAGVHGEALKGQHFGFGQQEYRGVIAQIGKQLVVQAAGVLQAGRYGEDGAARRVPKRAEVGRLVVGRDGKRGAGVGGTQLPAMPLQPGLRAEEGKQSG